MRRLAALIAFLALAGPLGVLTLVGQTAAQPTKSGRRVLRLPAFVTQLAADGPLITVTSCGPGPYWLYTWNPARRSVVRIDRGGCREGFGGILDQGIAGRRLAWVPYDAGNYNESELVSATVRRPRPVVHLTGTKVHNSDSGEGDWVGHIDGDGSLLVFNTWSVCENDEPVGESSCPEGFPPGSHVLNEKVWRIVGRLKRLLLSSPDEATVLGVAAGRILLRRGDGSLEIRRVDGSLVRTLPFGEDEVVDAVLDACELVILHRGDRRTWRVFDPVSGEQKRELPAPAGATVQDVERGLLVYTFKRAVHVLRLADGRQKSFRTPVGSYPIAQIEPPGLSYSYEVGREGRVRFIPFAEIGVGRRGA